MTLVNPLLNRLFDLLFAPIRSLNAGLALALVSLLTAVALLLVVRATSDQRALTAVKRQIHADLFEIRLFNDDLGAMIRAQGSILRHNATYLRLSLVPVLWTVIPLVVVLAQLESYFGYSGATMAQPILVTAELRSPTEESPAVLDVPSGFRVDAAGVWFPAVRQLVWRVVPDSPGDYVLQLRIGGASYTKTLHVSGGLVRRSVMRKSATLLDEIWHPSEAPLADATPVKSIAVGYPARSIRVLRWEMPWELIYLLESIGFALILRVPLRVTV